MYIENSQVLLIEIKVDLITWRYEFCTYRIKFLPQGKFAHTLEKVKKKTKMQKSSYIL